MPSPVKCKECGRVTLYLSWSRLRTFEACGHSAYLQSVKKVRVPPQNHRNFFAGTVTDRTVRYWLENDPYNNPRTMPDLVETFMESSLKETEESGNFVTWRDDKDQSRIFKECVTAVTRIEDDLNRLVLPYEYQADYGFKTPVSLPHPRGGQDVVMLNGYMDILVHDPDKDTWSIYDVKHTKDNQYWRKTLGQLSFYDLAIFIAEGKQAVSTGLLQPLCNERVFSMRPTPDTLRDLSARVNRMATSMWQDTPPPPRTDMEHCTFCSVKHACSKFKPSAFPRPQK